MYAFKTAKTVLLSFVLDIVSDHIRVHCHVAEPETNRWLWSDFLKPIWQVIPQFSLTCCRCWQKVWEWVTVFWPSVHLRNHSTSIIEIKKVGHLIWHGDLSYFEAESNVKMKKWRQQFRWWWVWGGGVYSFITSFSHSCFCQHVSSNREKIRK